MTLRPLSAIPKAINVKSEFRLNKRFSLTFLLVAFLLLLLMAEATAFFSSAIKALLLYLATSSSSIDMYFDDDVEVTMTLLALAEEVACMAAFVMATLEVADKSVKLFCVDMLAGPGLCLQR